MDQNEKQLRKFLLQSLRDSGELNDMPEELLEDLVDQIIESGAISVETPEQIAQRETDALFERLGVGK